MKLVKAILEPSYLRKAQFDSISSTNEEFRFACANCGESISVPYRALIGKEWSWKEDFDDESRKKIEDHFDMNEVGKTPDGSWTAIDKCKCRDCGATYLIYGGVNEYANSAHKVSVQGIAQILNV